MTGSGSRPKAVWSLDVRAGAKNLIAFSGEVDVRFTVENASNQGI
jgi:hypothetical protein